MRQKNRTLDAVIGHNIRDLRTRKGIGMSDLAAAMNVSWQQVQKYESGRNSLSADRLHFLKNYFGVPYDFFFGSEERKTIH